MRRFCLRLLYMIGCLFFIFVIQPPVINSMDQGDDDDSMAVDEDEDDEEDGGEPSAVVASAPSGASQPVEASLSGELDIRAPLRDSRRWVSSFRFTDIPYDPTPWHLSAATTLEGVGGLGQRVRTTRGVLPSTNTALASIDFVLNDGTVIHYTMPYAFLSGSASQVGTLSAIPPISWGDFGMPITEGQGAAAAAAAGAAAEHPPQMGIMLPILGGDSGEGDALSGAATAEGAAAAADTVSSSVGSQPFSSLIDYWPPPAGRKKGHVYGKYRPWLRRELFQDPVTDLEDEHRAEMLRITGRDNDMLGYLHSEPTILSYLSQEKVLDAIVGRLVPLCQEGRALRAVVLNVSSFLDICPRCADTLFYNSALRGTFIKGLIAKLREKSIIIDPRSIRLINLVSSIHPHSENIGRSTSRDSQAQRHTLPLSFDRGGVPSWVLQMSIEDLRGAAVASAHVVAVAHQPHDVAHHQAHDVAHQPHAAAASPPHHDDHQAHDAAHQPHDDHEEDD